MLNVNDSIYLGTEDKAEIAIGGDGMTPSEKKALEENTKARHTHNNKDVLDGITAERVEKWDNGQGGGSSVEIVDNLISEDTDKALSANMGRELFNTIGSVSAGLQNEIIAYSKNKVDKVDGMGLSEVLDIIYYSRNLSTGENESSLNIVDQNQVFQEIVFYNKEQIDNKMGEIETALDEIIAIKNELIGGESA